MAPRSRQALLLLCTAALLSGCGGGGDGDSDTEAAADLYGSDEVVAAFEKAAGGYRFEPATTLVNGAKAFAPQSSANPAKLAPLTEALGDGSVLWQVVVFDGPDPPLDREAAKAAAFSSNTFEPAGEGVYLGDSDIAYAANGNVVATGPVLNGDTNDQTLVRWKATLDGL